MLWKKKIKPIPLTLQLRSCANEQCAITPTWRFLLQNIPATQESGAFPRRPVILAGLDGLDLTRSSPAGHGMFFFFFLFKLMLALLGMRGLGNAESWVADFQCPARHVHEVFYLHQTFTRVCRVLRGESCKCVLLCVSNILSCGSTHLYVSMSIYTTQYLHISTYIRTYLNMSMYAP